jgi:phosphoserine phosphatase
LALAIFDVDGTLVAGPSTEKRLFWMLLRAGRLGPRQLGAFLRFGTGHAGRTGGHSWKRNKAYLAGLACDEVAALAARWVSRSAADWWYGPCVERLRRHLAAGDDVVLLTGTPQFVADALVKALGGGRAIGTLCAAEAGRFLASPPVRHPFGGAKLELARGLCAETGAAPADLVAYGDSVHDLPLLRFAGRAVAVRPDSGLAAAARVAGWEIIGRR